MRFIFLDIDGVLNSNKCKVKLRDKYNFVEDEKILLLKDIVDKTNAKIVLSSDWRKGWYDLDEKIESFDKDDFILLRDKLKEYDLTLYDYTSLPVRYERGVKIKEWIEEHLEDVDSILILDDEADIYPLEKYLLRTSKDKGLTNKHVTKGIEILLNDNFKSWAKKKELFKEKIEWNMEL